jgi:predicted DNA-binding transcriptional regulator AlpA
MVMTPSAKNGANTQENSRKLVSWKAIAEYLGCDARTAKRWEADRQMPVHRAPGGKRSGVFAYSAEVDEWLHPGIRPGLASAQSTPSETPTPATKGAQTPAAPRTMHVGRISSSW